MTQERFLAIFDQYRPMVYALALSYTRSPQDAEDVCQTVFLRLLERPPEPGKEKPWLAQVTVNECRSLLRAPWRKRRVELDERALASSAGLREMLAAALGGFAPYVQEQEGEPYVIDGIEFRVKSVLADDFTVRAYMEARDVAGDIFDKIDDITIPTRITGGVDVPPITEWLGPNSGESWSSGVECLGYDEETKTALLVVSAWKLLPEDLSSAAVEVRLSPLGLTFIFEDNSVMRPALESSEGVSVKLKDGSIVKAPQGGMCSVFPPPFGESSYRIMIWNFLEPVEADQIEGVYVGGDYFPMQ